MIKAILTGHTKGLGHGILQTLSQQNIPVLGIARSQTTQATKQCMQVQLDLSDPVALEQWLGTAELPGFIQDASEVLLINNAGWVSPIGPLPVQATHLIAKSVQLNVASPMVLSAFLAQHISEQQTLRILHVSSGAARHAYPGWSVYCATKAALDMHAQAVHADEQANIKICSLAPGVIDTDMQAQIRDVDPTHFPIKQRFIDLKNKGQLSSARHTASALVDFLLSPEFGASALADLRD
jgi:benzil reductase ((S)-benzoin forming)